MTLRINSGASQAIDDLREGRINRFSAPVSITTQWDLAASATIDLVGYFASPQAALSSGTDAIPSRYVAGRMHGGVASSYAEFTQNAISGVGTAGGSLHLFRQPVTISVNSIGQRTDNLELQLDLRGSPSLPAGRYTGTLTLRAVAY